ncbi:23S rRNA (adenine(2503)-C(2))-methyltransferase RlmN [bacterium]|nr:23S rRNA (adenine(2503)-C(2))-methyltransferase RlmN [bacterium]
MKKINLKSLSRQEFNQFIDDIHEKPFRADQIWSWIYQKNVISFDGMTNISRPLRATLERIAFIRSLKLIKKTISSISKTEKFLWRLEDGLLIESVYIPEGKRRTVCISSQVGCALKCHFCATGTMGFIRNLEVEEITDQILSISREVGQKPTNIVVMGMGEPLLNVDNVMKALYILNQSDGIAIGHRKITISTAGIIPQLIRYTNEAHPFKLAISLNATTDSQRTRLMPINKTYPLSELLQTARLYTQKTKKRITFEYVLIKGINDTQADAHRLLRLLKGIPCKVNLIAYNPTSGLFEPPDDTTIHRFAETIRPLCAPVTMRLSKGDDIHAACGQLAVAQPKIKSHR